LLDVLLLVSEYIIKLSLEWLGPSVVRIQVEQTGSRRVNAVQYKLVTLTLGEDQKLTLSECRAKSSLRVVERPVP